MKAISYDTAGQIAYAHKEIESAKTLLAELEKAEQGRELPDLRDAFGRRRGIELGVPSGDASRRCFNVDPRLAIVVLRAHVASQQSLIEALSQQAVAEMSTPTE
jgi:hypothetical protein